NQASTANTTIPLAAAIAALVATSGAAIQSKVTPTTRTASSCRGLRITDRVRRIDTWELKGITIQSRATPPGKWLRILDTRCITQTIHKRKAQSALAPAQR